ncbi:BCCT family transporter [Clostridium aminobutyricum]|uniref:BCCT family transporter n=1 Tax=Clostridium aminobutyricum TaxID=33953 RepID=A0A939IIB1_CLOAM|nr:BCCT family transporter [Clostridium aminobutyricum]MBN7772378.1 BCCT family transporter [Clostridium aminobutyricum]
MENNLNKKDRGSIETGLIIVSVLLLAAFIIFMVLNPVTTVNGISGFFWKMISVFGPIFEVFTFATFIIAIYLGFGKYGKVRLGDCKPEYSTFSYIAMMLLASLASAALYWSFTEWAYYYEAPGLGMEAHSTRALESALGYQFFHWGMTNQAMYTVMGVAIAYGVYIKKVPSFQASAVCSAMMGEKVKGKSAIGKVIDFCVIFGILGGLGSSLGLAVPLATGGIKQLTGAEATPVIQIGVIVVIALVYTFTSYLGTDKGMKVISNGSAILCFVFLLYVLFTGPTTFILKNIINSFGYMIQDLPRMSLFTDPVENTGFPENWTIYFQAFYLNYLAMMGIFIAKVSKGRTLREVAIATMFGISAGGWFLFGVDGSFSIKTFLDGSADVVGLVNSGIGDAAIYSILEVLPLGATFLPVIVLLLIVGFVGSSMDAASLALAETVTKRGTPKMALRLFWCILLAVIPMSIILSGSGFDAIKQLAVIISVPFLIIVVGMEIGLFKWLRHDSRSGLHARNIELQEKEDKEEFEQKARK